MSEATASRSISGAANRVVAEDLRARVLQAAAELGYAPNAHAQAMARGRSNVLGLVLQDIADPYFSSVAAGVMREARQEGVLVTLGSTSWSPNEAVSYVVAFRRNRARAIIVVGSLTDDDAHTERLTKELAAFEAEGGRAVAISQPGLGVDTIAIDNRNASLHLAEALCGLGYRDYAVLAGPPGLLTAVDRVAGFREGLARHAVRVTKTNVIASAFTRDGGWDATSRLLKRGSNARCLFAVNDLMAVGAMAYLRESGKALPNDMAVAGFDDIETLRDISPALTTVRVPLEEVGAQATRMVLASPAPSPRLVKIAGELVLRATTPPLTAALASRAGRRC